MILGNVVIGKRVPIGAALTSTAVVLAQIWPEYDTIIMSAAIPITMVVQVLLAHFAGITNAPSK